MFFKLQLNQFLKSFVTENVHAGHHFGTYVQVSEDRAKNNTRRLRMTAQEGVWPGHVDAGHVQRRSHVPGKTRSLSGYFPSLHVTKTQWPQLADSVTGR